MSSPCRANRRAVGALGLACLLVTGCEREDREFRDEPAPARQAQTITLGTLSPGQPSPPGRQTTDYEQSAYNVSEGKRLYIWFNCVGCHAHGGGGMGPALIDAEWIYGSEPANIFATIVEGRPNGMPSFRGKIPDQQVWQLVSYVRSLGGLLRKDIDTGRSDSMRARPSEQSLPDNTPRPAFSPPASEGRQ